MAIHPPGCWGSIAEPAHFERTIKAYRAQGSFSFSSPAFFCDVWTSFKVSGNQISSLFFSVFRLSIVLQLQLAMLTKS